LKDAFYLRHERDHTPCQFRIWMNLAKGYCLSQRIHKKKKGRYLGDCIYCTHHTVKPLTNDLPLVEEVFHRDHHLVGGGIDKSLNVLGCTDNTGCILFDLLKMRTVSLTDSALDERGRTGT